MKALTTAFCLFIVASIFGQSTLNVMTFNIRLDTAGDSLNARPYRKDKVASQVLFHKVHLLGVQEALPNQVQELQERLPNYKYVGVGRTDGNNKGEYSAIFFDTTRIKLLNSQTFWLAEETTAPKKGWDAAFERIVTWAKFEDKQTGRTFYQFNTHFDHMGKVARRESAKLILQKVKDIAGKTPSLITGDFNAEPSDEPVQILLDKNNPNVLTDAKSISVQPHYGPTGTFTGFKSKEISNEPIDYIFIKNGVKVLQHATLSQTWEGRFSSDHFPVFAVVQIL